VDEAHSTGLFGQNGRGLVCELGLEKDIFARVHTFGKAIGASGGKKLVTYPQLNFEETFIDNHCSHRPIFPGRTRISHQLCSDTYLYNGYVIPQPRQHPGRI
jgi:8-amino-7-oxononanoate synthase